VALRSAAAAICWGRGRLAGGFGGSAVPEWRQSAEESALYLVDLIRQAALFLGAAPSLFGLDRIGHLRLFVVVVEMFGLNWLYSRRFRSI